MDNGDSGRAAVEPAALERLFVAGRLSRGQFLQGLLAAGVTASGIENLLGAGVRPALAADATPRYLVLIVLDAFRPDYLDLAPMPALTALASEGVYYDGAWVGQMESVTPVSHASLSTGALPSRTGVVGFEWRNGLTKAESLDGWPPYVLKGDLEEDLRLSGTSSIPMAIKAANPQARIVSISSEKVYAADAMGGPAADYILYDAYGPHNLTLVHSAVPGHVPPPSFFKHPLLGTPHVPVRSFHEWDQLSGRLARAAFDEFRPAALMVNLPGSDVYGHAYGPAVPTVMRNVAVGQDHDIALIVAAYKKAGIYDQTLFVVVADHGMVQNSRAVDVSVIKSVVQAAGGKYFFHWGGTGACIWLHNWWHARSVAGALSKVKGVTAAYYQVNHHGVHQYLPAPGMQIAPDLDAANQFLLSTFAGKRGPDVVAPFRENTIGRIHRYAHGDHGGLNWGSQHVPLIMRGPGVAAGAVSHYPARLVDVAPTVLRLLGVSHGRMDGVVLADALTGAGADEVAAQAALEPVLTAHRSALVAQSQQDIAEDARLGIHPPPAPP